MSTGFYPIDGPWPGTLAISPRPRGGDWLEDEVKSWRNAGFDVIVSLLTPDEIEEMELQQEPRYCGENHVKFVSFPIVDRSVPDSRIDAQRLIEQLDADLARGKRVNVHCRQGIGRSGLIAASILIAKGLRPAEAVQKVSSARKSAVPETVEQREWIDAMVPSLSSEPQVKSRS
jgi:protein-tyrosine phosphatase